MKQSPPPSGGAPAPFLTHEFQLDRFQLDAMAALDDGSSVLVAAPTGSGKTVVAEHAVRLALASGSKLFYTAPIKALSNQKYRDLTASLGADRVGLLTGDHSINGEAPIVVMTTEVLRNMLYAQSPTLQGLRYVVLDEVHYLEDRYRGPVWEEVILNVGPEVQLVCLSATVSNSDELAAWIGEVHGPTERITETRRPVELENLFMVGDRSSDRLHLLPILVDGRPNREGHRFDPDRNAPDPRSRYGRRSGKGREARDGKGREARDVRGRPRQLWATPRRLMVLDELERRELLPAIVFIFSRSGCDEAARACFRAGVRLTEPAEQAEIRRIAEVVTSELPPSDLAVLGFDSWIDILEAGIASHHAGLVPPFKEAVERAFSAGLVKVVFATETLALGINMPARSVVIERLTKFTGERHEFLTPGQYTQLTGRAGRRGIDDRGTAVVLWSPFVSFGQISSLVGSHQFELRSAFRPTYNMAANLISGRDRAAAEDLLGRSFAQFQLDRSVSATHVRLERARAELARAREAVGERRPQMEAERAQEAHFGERDAAEVGDAVDRLRPGDVITMAHVRYVVLGISHRRNNATQLRLVDSSGDRLALSVEDLVHVPLVRGHLELPEPFAPNSAYFLNDVAHRLVRARLKSSPTTRAADQLRPARDRGERAADLDPLTRLETAEAAVARIERRLGHRGESLVHRFDTVLDLLGAWGYVRGWALTDRGEVLRRVFHESDLLVAEALHRGLLDDLDPAELAALVSMFVYEHRSPTPPDAPWYPSRRVRDRANELVSMGHELERAEQQRALPETRIPDPTFVGHAHAWALGVGLDDVFDVDEDVSAGDFVRIVKQVNDLLSQIVKVAPSPETRRTARAALDSLDRGVVASSGRVSAAEPA